MKLGSFQGSFGSAANFFDRNGHQKNNFLSEPGVCKLKNLLKTRASQSPLPDEFDVKLQFKKV